MNGYTEGNLAFQEDPREELIGGRVVMMASPSMNHSRISGNIFSVFHSYLAGHPCEPCQDGTALFLEDDTEEYKPDMMVVCDPDKFQWNGVHGAPDLVVEVLSPSTARYDRGHKKEMYEKHGVKEYWIVSPGDHYLEQYVLEDGRFVLRGIYAHYSDFMLRKMREEEKAALVTEFRCSLFDDLTIRVDQIFARVTFD